MEGLEEELELGVANLDVRSAMDHSDRNVSYVYKWIPDHSDTDMGYVYKFQAIQQKEKLEEKNVIAIKTKGDSIFHHNYAPVGTSDSWYVKVNGGDFPTGYCVNHALFYGGSWMGTGDVYVSLRYVRYVAQIHKDNVKNM